MRGFTPYILLAALCVFLFFWQLGAEPLIGLDEGLYSECSREMLVSGDYIVPTCNGLPFFDKPPLGYWLQALSMNIFGVNSFAARLPSALAATFLVGLTVFLGTKMFDRTAGLLSGFVLATSILTAVLAHMAILDQLFALMICAALGSFILTYLGIWQRKGYLLFWTATALSVMVKGPAGAVLIWAIVIIFLLLRRQVGEIKRIFTMWGVLIFFAITIPWYVLVQINTNGGFAGEFFIHQNIQRAMGKDFAHNQPFYFYIPIFLIGFFPWSVFTPSAWLRRVKLRPKETADVALLFAAVWMMVIFGIFSILRSKLPSYVFPLFPASALLVGAMWSRVKSDIKVNRLLPSSSAALAISGLIAAGFLIGMKYLRTPIPGLANALIPMGVALVIGSGLALVLITTKKTSTAFASLCAGMVVFLVVAIQVGLPIAARTLAQPVVKMAGEIQAKCPPKEQVIAYRLAPPQPALAFYSNHLVPGVADYNKLIDTLKSSKQIFVIIQDDCKEILPKGGELEATVGRYMLYKFEGTSDEGNRHLSQNE